MLVGLCPLAVTLAAAQVRVTKLGDRVAISISGKPYADFFLAPDGNKPYVYPLRTASGIIVTRRFPIEKVEGETTDHPHHRGMFFSHGDVNGLNFWATEPGSKSARKASMVLKAVLEANSGEKSGTIKAVFEGLDPKGKPILRETRDLIFYSHPVLRIIDFGIAIEALEKLVFGDTKEGTFGIRLATPLSEAKTGRMVNAEGRETEKNVWGKRSPWVDYYGQLEGQTVGVAILDHPANPRHPTYWHSRAYGLFAANPFGIRDFTGDKTQDGSMTFEPGQSVRFRYRVIIHPGDVKAANIAKAYKEYAASK
ncbi:MAG TPA: PmoA family protein [Bryobacteraceae bacterium]|nr:PmoA family protein [Bryobacteraceae bacterium]